MESADIIIVGCGLSGAVTAERLATLHGKRCLILEKRDHIGGNCYDRIDPETGILMNLYGAHLFHTDSERVWEYVQRFAKWIPWEHRVVARVCSKNENDEKQTSVQYVPLPVNRSTINLLCGTYLRTEEEAREWLSRNRERYETVQNSEEAACSGMGRKLYDTLVRDYTRKQWGCDASQLDPSVLARIPVRTDLDSRYFGDRYQALPEGGYTQFFQRLLDHPLIHVQLNTDWFDFVETTDPKELESKQIIFTGPIDHFYRSAGYEPLEYRSVQFHVQRFFDTPFYQPNSVVNYPGSDTPYTRTVEYKHFLNQSSPHTVIVSETTTDEGEPYYPVPKQRNRELYQRYQELADREERIHFVGRLANYKYFNMDQAILNALEFVDGFVKAPAPSFYHWSNKEIHEIKAVVKLDKSQHSLHNPRGLWFSKEREWLDWCLKNLPIHTESSLCYKLEIDFGRFRIIRDIDDLLAFNREYGSQRKIHWDRVAKAYDGIFFDNYTDVKKACNQRGLFNELCWFYSIDVSSGCIFNTECVKSFVNTSPPQHNSRVGLP